MSNDFRPNVRHLSDEQLLMLTDGELPEREATRARQHVDGCWSCRERLDGLQSVINSITRRRNEVLEVGDDGPTRPWASLESRLDSVDTVLHQRSAFGLLLQSVLGFVVAHRTRWVAAMLTASLVVAVWLTREPALSASELLVKADAAAAPAPTEVVHRTLQLEQRELPARRLLKRQRIEIWQSTTQGKARRLYDDDRGLAAGEWTRPDGSRTVYRAGESPARERTADSSAPLNDRDIWRWEPSARDFLALAGSVELATIEEQDDAFVLEYRPAHNPPTGLVEARLTLDKSNLRPTAHTLLLRSGGEDREYRLSETGFERVSAEGVVPAMFQVEPVLLNEPIAITAAVVPLPATPVVKTKVETALTETELDRLELDSTYQLHRARIWVGQQGRILRTAAGVTVDAAVPTEAHKSILERSFTDLQGLSAVSINLTVSPDEKSVTPGARLLADQSSLRAMPVYLRLDTFFSAVAPEGREEIIRAVASWVLERLQRRAERLRAMQTLVDQWPEKRLHGLELERVVRWQAMLQEHAEAVRHETELLRVQLASAFGMTGTSPSTRSREAELLSVATVGKASADLMNQTGAQDDVLEAAFTPCPNASCADVDVEQLMRTLSDIESLAASFAGPWSLGR